MRNFHLGGIAAVMMGLLLLGGCSSLGLNEAPKPRLVMFVGVDVSGSFAQSTQFDDSISFLARYLYAHLNGLGGLEVPNALFVGSLGGARPGQSKAFYPIETFQDKPVSQIETQLRAMFPKDQPDNFTDYNAFIGQVADMVKDRRMVLKPLSLVMVSDGQVDVPGPQGRHNYRGIDFSPLEKLSRNVTVRLLYTSPDVGKKWEDAIPRRRVKVWVEPAQVMDTWKDSNLYVDSEPLDQQGKFLAWIKDNVDYGVRMRRVD